MPATEFPKCITCSAHVKYFIALVTPKRKKFVVLKSFVLIVPSSIFFLPSFSHFKVREPSFTHLLLFFFFGKSQSSSFPFILFIQYTCICWDRYAWIAKTGKSCWQRLYLLWDGNKIQSFCRSFFSLPTLTFSSFTAFYPWFWDSFFFPHTFSFPGDTRELRAKRKKFGYPSKRKEETKGSFLVLSLPQVLEKGSSLRFWDSEWLLASLWGDHSNMKKERERGIEREIQWEEIFTSSRHQQLHHPWISGGKE